VLLNGAAYFDVVHDASRPFVVVTRGLRIRDLGTKFVVDAYGDAPSADTGPSTAVAPLAARIAVSAGAVQIEAIPGPGLADRGGPGRRSGFGPSVVDAGHVARLDADGRITVSRPPDIDQFMSWTHGELVFDDVLLSDAIPRLERWYGTRVLLGDAHLACRHITASFDNESLDQALDALSLVLHTHRVQSGRSITLEPDTTTAETGAGNRTSTPDDCRLSVRR
jgi:ferric-dicitrate binding protein FerR (iron transport regulator)